MARNKILWILVCTGPVSFINCAQQQISCILPEKFIALIVMTWYGVCIDMHQQNESFLLNEDQGWGDHYSGTLVLPKMINMNILKTLYSSTDFPVLVLVCSVLAPALMKTELYKFHIKSNLGLMLTHTSDLSKTYYLTQCWFIGALGTYFSEILNPNCKVFFQENAIENVICMAWHVAFLLQVSICQHTF